MEETRILIQAELDIQKTKNAIDAQIGTLSQQLSKLNLNVEIDTKSAQQALKQEEDMQKKLAATVSSRYKQEESAAKKQATTVKQNLDSEHQGRQKLNAEIEKTQARISSLAKDMSKAGADSGMVSSVKALSSELEKVENNSDLSKINQQLNALQDGFVDAQQAAKQVQFDKDLAVDIQRAQAALEGLGIKWEAIGKNSEFSQEIARLSAEAENLSTKADLTSFNKQVALLKTQLGNLNSEFKVTENAAKQVEIDKNLAIDIQKAQTALKAFGQEWSAIGSNAELSGEFARLSAEAENLTSRADLTNFNKQVQLFQAQAKEAGVATKSWGAEVKATILDLAGLASVTAVFMQAWNKIKEIIANVHELDTAMTEFNKVANLSASGTEKFLDSAAMMAKQMSASLTDVISAQTEFKKLGFSTADSQELGRLAILYDNVGDAVGGVNQATSSLISTMKAFGIGVADAESIVDKFNEVANETSIDSGEIGSALQRSASALALAGESIDTSIGLIVGGNEVVRDADKVGRHSCPAA